MTALKSLAFCVGWIITAYIGIWAMALYGVTIGIITWRTYDHRGRKYNELLREYKALERTVEKRRRY